MFVGPEDDLIVRTITKWTKLTHNKESPNRSYHK